MQPDAQHVDAKPAPSRDNVSEDGEGGETALFRQSSPARVEIDGVPNYDHEGTVFFGVPAPETAPRLVSPDAAEDRADEAEQSGEAHDAVDHA